MRASVCIPTFQRPYFLEKALRSVLEQSQPPLEVLVGDDAPRGSALGERTERLVRQYAENSEVPVRYVRHEPPRGQAGNVEALFQRAKGERLVLLHDDDLLLPGALETLSRCFEGRPKVVAAYGKQRLISHEGEVLREVNEHYRRTKEHEGVQHSALIAAITQQFPNDGFMVKARVAKRIGYATAGVGSACDFGFGVRLARTGGDYYYCDEYVSAYRLSTNSIARGGGQSDAPYFAFKLVESMPEKVRRNTAIHTWLRRNASAAIMAAAHEGRTAEGLRWYGGPYHRDQILTLGGAHRLLTLLSPANAMKKPSAEGGLHPALRKLCAEMERHGLRYSR